MGLKEHGLESVSSCFSKLLSLFVRHIRNSLEVVCFSLELFLSTGKVSQLQQKNQNAYMIYGFTKCAVLSVINQNMNRRGQLVAFLAWFISYTTGAICRALSKYGAIAYLCLFSILTPIGTILKIWL